MQMVERYYSMKISKDLKEMDPNYHRKQPIAKIEPTMLNRASKEE